MRKIYYTVKLLSISLLALPFSAFGQELNDPFARDILILTEWFAGEFDNEEQRWFEEGPRSATPEVDRHARLHTMHKRVELPAFGEHVFYVEEYKDHDPADIVRQRLVIFSTDMEENAIRMQQGFFKDGDALLGAYLEPENLGSLQAEDVFFLPECDVFWRRVADQFEGQMKPRACVFGEEELRRYSVHNLILSATKYWRTDTTFLVGDDSLHVGYPVDRPVEMRRAKAFICTAAFANEDGSRQSVEGLRVHSQGGTADVVRESDGEAFTLRLRDKEYPYYETRPDFLFFSVMKKGEVRSLAYAVTDPRARSIGINASGILAYCYRDGYTFRQDYENL